MGQGETHGKKRGIIDCELFQTISVDPNALVTRLPPHGHASRGPGFWTHRDGFQCFSGRTGFSPLKPWNILVVQLPDAFTSTHPPKPYYWLVLGVRVFLRREQRPRTRWSMRGTAPPEVVGRQGSTEID